MTTKPIMSGYQIEVKDPLGKKRPVIKTFTHLNLLAARQSALQYAQELQAEPSSTHSLEITMCLVEFDRSLLAASPEIICLIFNQQLKPNLIIPQGKLERISLSVELGQNGKEYPVSTSGTNWNSLEFITNELNYYHSHGYDTGLSDQG